MSESPSSRKAVSARSAKHPFEVAARTPHKIVFGPTTIHGDGLHVAMSRGRGPRLSTDRRPFSPAFRSTAPFTRSVSLPPAAPARGAGGRGREDISLVPPDLARPQPGRSAPPEVRTSGHRRHHAHEIVPGGSEHLAVRTFGRRRHDRDLPGSSEPVGHLTKPDLRLPARIAMHDALAVCPDSGRAPRALVRGLDDETPQDRRPRGA